MPAPLLGEAANKAPEKTVTASSSAGSGPTMSIPGTSMSSLTCWIATSTSPLAASSPVRPPSGAQTSAGWPSVRATRATFSPLPPAATITSAVRSTAPRRSPGKTMVRSRAGFGVTISSIASSGVVESWGRTSQGVNPQTTSS